ncbi:MAG: Crp/Fnr family transcriptional regulator [Gomphosphaeria aponina SAG 52.96 = DSM 107014]|uniref:Crp/Fnr family transcriptional regulator n=1 Tax=Gomphosphaeria aponina SAG 52.96 = DSM 107014 TaxID=1521640 RepID=A0A941GQW0_9CHRO|nr:Crp/Fnr family transcriptional regulator [Gomphosphaeria aponina SAG 52.96 = DSM 107014]
METPAFSELFDLFSTASAETLEWLPSITEEQEYEPNSAILTQNTWGNAVYFIVSGWVKVQHRAGENAVTLEILGPGDFFGEVAILDETPRATEIVAISAVKSLSISAQRFLQTLFRDPQVNLRLSKLMVRKMRLYQSRLQLQWQPSKVKLVKILLFLGENYGKTTEKGTEIFQIPDQDLADLAAVNLEEIIKNLEGLQNQGLVEIDESNQILCLSNPKQLAHLYHQSRINFYRAHSQE